MYYLLSLKHTDRNDKFVTFWGRNNAGYFISREKIGVYDEIKKGYHDSEVTMPIHVDHVQRLFDRQIINGETVHVIKNTEFNCGFLGVKFSKGRLVRLKK